jgi:argininosuccinate lyase
MPQKKNPDPLELIRAKCGRVATNFNSAITIMHGLPSGYNLDYQEITPLLWESIDELQACIQILTVLVPQIQVREVENSVSFQFTAATEIANILVREERVPFRTAHRIVGAVVRSALESGKSIDELQEAEWQRYLERPIGRNTIALMTKATDLRQHLLSYRTSGSPNPQESRKLINTMLNKWSELRRRTMQLRVKVERSERELQSRAIKGYQE